MSLNMNQANDDAAAVWKFYSLLELIFSQGKLEPMKQLAGDSQFDELLQEMSRIHSIKSQAYDGTHEQYNNFKTAKELGVKPVTAVMIRMNDKWQRLINLIVNEQDSIGDETVKDTFLDLASYCLIGLILYERD